MSCTVAVALVACGCTTPRSAPTTLAARAHAMDDELRHKTLPYWFDTTQDLVNGGYLLADDAEGGRTTPADKLLVTQARMVWGLAHAHRKGYSDQRRNYLHAASGGYRFLLARLRDVEHGGYFWKTDLSGAVLSDRKLLYGQAFVIYALVEYARASDDREPLHHALELYRTVQARAHDARYGGWNEHFTREWQPSMAWFPGDNVEVPGYKSANTHLHWMEALSELYVATGDADVKRSLAEVVGINSTYFFPADPGRFCAHRRQDWRAVEPSGPTLSYGHNVEFAWLLIRAQQVLGVPPSWARFDALIDHTLRFGFDRERGGVFDKGADDRPATVTDKVWWSQAEMLAALSDGLKHAPNPRYADALERLIDFVWKYQVDRTDGIWLDTVTAEGRPKKPGKAHRWKANYHDVRAMVKFIETFR